MGDPFFIFLSKNDTYTKVRFLQIFSNIDFCVYFCFLVLTFSGRSLYLFGVSASVPKMNFIFKVKI